MLGFRDAAGVSELGTTEANLRCWGAGCAGAGVDNRRGFDFAKDTGKI